MYFIFLLLLLHEAKATSYYVPSGSTCESYSISDLDPQSTGVKKRQECMKDCVTRNCSYMRIEDDGECIIGGEGRQDPSASCSWLSYIMVPLQEDVLQNKTEVTLNKPTQGPPAYTQNGNTFPKENGNDGNKNTLSIGQQMTRPWWMVDLQKTYRIFFVEFFGRNNYRERHTNIKVYVADKVPLDGAGNPDTTDLILFSQQIPAPTSQSDVRSVHKKPEGQCGRFLLIVRDKQNDFLEITHIRADGYPFR